MARAASLSRRTKPSRCIGQAFGEGQATLHCSTLFVPSKIVADRTAGTQSHCIGLSLKMNKCSRAGVCCLAGKEVSLPPSLITPPLRVTLARRTGPLRTSRTHALPLSARQQSWKQTTQTARTNRRMELSLTRSDVNQGSPVITRVYSTVTLGVVATPKTGTAVVGPLAARPM
jgi:hypothetical protein